MSYQIIARANHVNVGDRVLKDRKWHTVTDVKIDHDSFDASGASSTYSLVFGNHSTIPLHAGDYITVKRSSSATSPERQVAPMAKDKDILVLEGDDEDYDSYGDDEDDALNFN